MNVEEFEGCCTARIFTDLGGSRTSQYGYHEASYDRLRKEVVRGIKRGHEDGAGIITAIVTNEQVTGAKVLKDLGFTGTGMASKTSHRNVQIELYYLHCKDWAEPALPDDIVATEAPVVAPQPFAAARNPVPQPAPVQLPVARRGAHPVRDAQGRFVRRDGIQGYVTRRENRYNLTHVKSVTNNQGACRWTQPNGDVKIFTQLEYDQLVLARVGEYDQEIFFQPI
jgi:hypothetical protein